MEKKHLVSVVIRTLNEERYLPELLESIKAQESERFSVEVVLVDSGSTDNTLTIAESFGSRIVHIAKRDFSFGRSLNLGCGNALGDYLVFISGHCVPVDAHWIDSLVAPLLMEQCEYSYGRQLPRDTTKFSEGQLFQKYFPEDSRVPQVGIFCNNANAALRADIWAKFPFDEELTGCEDMDLAKRLVNSKLRIGYVAEAPVYHIHDESWAQVQRRYEREALALRSILPEIKINLVDTVRYFLVGCLKDFRAARARGRLTETFWSVIRFRWAQYSGAHKGHVTHRRDAKIQKERYFYPRFGSLEIGKK